ncbi:nuclear pore complex protein Nup155-like isoform X1 [Haliotis asinina]|uniref:nuclear pore complex protein Nup155-like isoform X1 n=1 Tax=Haliotis asinina TaxID=109174 RepID=UPI0035322AF1
MVSMMGSIPPLTLQDVLDSAGRQIDKHLQEDKNYLDLSELLRIPSHNQPTQSGLMDIDYPSLLEAGMGLEGLTEMTSVKRVPLPPELVEQFGRMQCNCMMGLFPDIERAWLTIDSDIFVWKYEDGTDLAYFDGLNDTIQCAALVKPKPGIFQPHIQYLLCLATAVDIVLLGVSFAKPFEGSSGELGVGEMHLLPDPLFSIPTDNTGIFNIAGADNGRIFMAGKDGCLYELAYQAEDGWFSRKCRKINHSTSKLSFLVPSIFNFSEDDPLEQICIDNSRNILYARSEKGTIQVFDLGDDGKGMGKVAALSQNTVMTHAAAVARTVERSNFKQIVHLAVITKSESYNIHLVAVTQSGVRLYFTTNQFGSSKGRPSLLTLVHVRLPPGFSASSTTQRPSNIHMAYHHRDTLMLVAPQNDDNDMLWAISSDSFPFQNQLMETQMTLPVDGKTWAMCESTTPLLPLPEATKSLSSRPDPPSVVTQHVTPPRRFIILSAQGSHILQKLRPMEQLQQLLIECQGPDADEVKGFFRLHRIELACATCLAIACSRPLAEQQVGDWARMAFFMYGGEAQYNFSAPSFGGHMGAANIGPASFSSGPMGSVPASLSSTVIYSPTSHGTSFAPFATPMPGMQPAHMSTPAPHSFQQSFYQPGLTSLGSHSQEVIYSGKHNGICIYLSRILRPFWDSQVTTEFPCQTPQGMVTYLTSSYSSDNITTTLELVRDLLDFMDFNSRFDSGGPVDSMMPVMQFQSRMVGPLDEQTKKKLQAEAQRQEKISLQHIQDMLHRVEEVLGLWKVLFDHQFHVIASGLTKDQQNQLRSMSFKQLVISGKEMCNSLITCLINRYLDDNATIDAISKKLREVCPSLYSSDDATCSKANELLQAARVNQNQQEKRKQLYEALRLYKNVNTPLQLLAVCSQFANINFYEGIVELCLTEARKLDPQDLASHFYHNGEPPEDTQGFQAYYHRMECYKCITEILGYLWSASVSHPQAPSVPKSPGPPPAPDPSRVAAPQADQYRTDILRMALKSEDALFHTSLYDWFFITNNSQKLLEIQTPYVEAYLKRKTQLHSGNVEALDMLWKYYEKIQNFPAAAKILSQLAERHSMDVPLHQRIEYLSRAIMCAKSSTSRIMSAAGGEFLHELEEKMEVARLQLQVQKAMAKSLGPSIPHGDTRGLLVRLDSELLDITTLYEEYADRFDLSECKLAIVHCAGLYDNALIDNLWQSIIDKDFSTNSAAAAQVRVTNISNHLVSVAKIYVNTERYFPVAFIIRHLEQKSCELNFDPNWVFQAMLDIGVAPPKLLEIYDRMFKSRDPYWQTRQKPLHLLVVLMSFLTHYSNNPNIIPTLERRRFSTVCLDAVSSYLVELQARSSADQTVRRLISQFKSLQSKLERL